MVFLREILEELLEGKISPEEAEKRLRLLCIREVKGIAKLDIGREIRKGIPEVVFGEGKETADIIRIARKYSEGEDGVLISRLSKDQMEALRREFGDMKVRISESGRIASIRKNRVSSTGGKVGLLAAGTSDISVAEEAKFVAENMGCEVIEAYDVGIAGIHRLFPHLEKMLKEGIDVLIVVAGMEGTLPSVVASMVDVPVIGVPTSKGYGLGGGGVGALTTMLQSCSIGVLVVNIDNGVAAGACAALIANRTAFLSRRHHKSFKPIGRI